VLPPPQRAAPGKGDDETRGILDHAWKNGVVDVYADGAVAGVQYSLRWGIPELGDDPVMGVGRKKLLQAADSSTARAAPPPDTQCCPPPSSGNPIGGYNRSPIKCPATCGRLEGDRGAAAIDGRPIMRTDRRRTGGDDEESARWCAQHQVRVAYSCVVLTTEPKMRAP